MNMSHIKVLKAHNVKMRKKLLESDSEVEYVNNVIAKLTGAAIIAMLVASIVLLLI